MGRRREHTPDTRAGTERKNWCAASIEVESGGTRFPVVYAEFDARSDSSEPSDEPIVYLHGLGSSRRDFEPAMDAPELAGHRLIALDLPGSGDGQMPRDVELGIDELGVVVEHVIATLAPEGVHLVGHSMGGLVGLLVASRNQERVRTFVNVEGNLAPVDCRVFSRRAIELATTLSPGDVLDRLAAELTKSGRMGYSTFVQRFRSEVRPEAFVNYCRSIVEISDREPLLEIFLALGMPRLFVYGENNRDLGYLDDLKRGGVGLAEVPRSDHFPIYTNPQYFFATVGNFVRDGKSSSGHVDR